RLLLAGKRRIAFDGGTDIVLHRRRSLPFHPNGMTFTAWSGGIELASRTYYSIGGGFVLDDDGSGHPAVVPDPTPVPYPFRTAAELLQLCTVHDLPVSEVMLADEVARRPEPEVRAGLLRIWSVMAECVRNGCATTGVLPGGLKVRRRAAELSRKLEAESGTTTDPLAAMDWVTLWAL